jgi:hypothetical protein
MAFDNRLHVPFLLAAALFFAMASTGAAQAQSVMDQCIQNGFKPGTSGFYRCLQEESGSGDDSDLGSKEQSGEAGSILTGDPQNAVTDYSGSSMDGASAPDRNILKNFNPGGPTR